MKKNETKNQHYVPRMYMARFGELVNAKKNIVCISFYQFNRGIECEKTSTTDICSDNYFYGEDQATEKFLSNLEGQWNNYIDRIVKYPEEPLSYEIICGLKAFAVFQIGRTNGTLEHFRAMEMQIVSEIFRDQHSKYSKDDVDRVIGEKMDELVKPSFLVDVSKQLVKEIDDLAFTVVQNNTQEPFIISDMPIIFLNPFSVYTGIGLADVGVFIMFPLSEKVMVCVYDSKMYTIKNNMISDETEIIKINKYQVLNADERIMSLKLENLKKYYKDEELIILRNKIRDDNNNVKVASWDTERIINGSSRITPYEIRLNFFSEPMQFRKLPQQCRDTLPRKYDKGFRHKLLVAKAKYPEIYRNHIKGMTVDGKSMTSYDRKMVVKGYQTVIEFMDNYWDVPAEERVDLSEEERNRVGGKFYKI